MTFEELANQLISEVKRALTKEYFDEEVPEKLVKLVTEFGSGHEVLPEIFCDGEFVAYIPEGGDSADIRWNKVKELPKEMQTFIFSYHSV